MTHPSEALDLAGEVRLNILNASGLINHCNFRYAAETLEIAAEKCRALEAIMDEPALPLPVRDGDGNIVADIVAGEDSGGPL